MNVEGIKEILAKDYGIFTEAELDKALKSMKRLDIGLMVSEKPKKARKGHGKHAEATA